MVGDFINNNTQTYEKAFGLICDSKKVPKELKDEYSVYELIAENNKLEDMDNAVIQPLVVFFNNEIYKDDDTGEICDGIKTYVLAQHEDGTIKMYNGFSLTFRLKFELLLGVFKNGLPKIQVTKVSKGKKQEYVIKPIRETKDPA